MHKLEITTKLNFVNTFFIGDEMIDKAIEIAVKAHTGQKDLGGDKYIFHPLRVMMKMKSMEEKVVAILHDVIEDSSVDLYSMDFPRHVLLALEAMTKNKEEQYKDYIKRVAQNSIAKKVKIADLEDNMDITRLFHLTEKDYKRRSMGLLDDVLTEY